MSAASWVSLQIIEATGLVIGVTFIVFFFLLAIYAVKKSMEVARERALRGLDSKTEPKTILREKEVVTEVVKVRCRSCGSLNLETNSFCELCGAKT